MNELTLKLDGTVNDAPVTPANAPLDTVITALEALRRFIASTSSVGEAIVGFSEGSLEMNIQPPIESALVLAEAVRQESHDAKDPYYQLVDTLAHALKRKHTLSFGLYLNKEQVLRITSDGTPIEAKELEWIETNTTIYGYLYDLGGVSPNIHVQTENYGNVRITATKEQIRSLRAYTFYNFSVECSMLRSDYSHLANCRLRYAIKANGDISLAEAISLEGPKWKVIGEVSEWVRSIRGES